MSDTSEKVTTSQEVQTSQEVMDQVVVSVGEPERPEHVTVTAAQPVEALLIGGRLHPLHRDLTCPVCIHHDRAKVERAIVDAFSYRSICDVVNKDRAESQSRPKLTPQMLERHVRDLHMEFAGAAMRIAADGRLREQGYDPAEVEGAIMPDGVALMRATIAKASHRLAKGEIQPTLSDALKASQVMAQIEASQQTTSDDDMAAIEEAFAVFWQGVVQVTTSEQQGQLALWIQNHPKLAALRARAERREMDPSNELAMTGEVGP